jgi:hypothetical protein
MLAAADPRSPPEFVAFHRTITECRARILYRGTDLASYNEPKALAQRG